MLLFSFPQSWILAGSHDTGNRVTLKIIRIETRSNLYIYQFNNFGLVCSKVPVSILQKMTLSYLLNLYNTNCAVKITKLKTCPLKSFARFIFGYPASPCHTILKSCHLKQPQNPQCPGCKNYSSPLLVRWPWAYRSWFESDRRLSSCCEPESMTEHVGIKFKLNGKFDRKGADTIIKWQPNLWQPIIVSMSHPVQPWMASLKFFYSWLYANQRAKSQNMLDCWRKVKLKLVLTYPGLTFAFPLGPARFREN